jgi:hypothetical protein
MHGIGNYEKLSATARSDKPQWIQMLARKYQTNTITKIYQGHGAGHGAVFWVLDQQIHQEATTWMLLRQLLLQPPALLSIGLHRLAIVNMDTLRVWNQYPRAAAFCLILMGCQFDTCDTIKMSV